MDLKTVGIVVGAIGLAGVVFVIGGGMVLPAQVHVTRSVDITASPETIHRLTGDLSRWEEWTTWNKTADPSLNQTFTGEPTRVGAKMTWKGDLLGEGAVAITGTSPETGLTYDLTLQGGRFPAKGAIRYQKTGDVTTVTWTDDSDLGSNPIAHWFGPMIASYIGNDFDQGLKNLRDLAENLEKSADEPRGGERHVIDPTTKIADPAIAVPTKPVP